MSHRFLAAVRPALIIAMVLSSLAMLIPASASAVQNDRGLVDSTTYQSPQFGYGITWSEPWATRERDVITNPGGFDTITLRGDVGTVRISGRADSYNPLTFLQDTIAIQIAGGGEVINQDTTGAVPTAELLTGNEKMRFDVLSLPDYGAIVLVSIRADQRDYDEAFASAQQGIQLEGIGLFSDTAPAPPAETPTSPPGEPTSDVTVPTEVPSPEATQEVLGGGVSGNTFTSPSFGFSVSWDPSIWTLPEDAEYSEPDYDTLTIESDTGPMWITGWKAYSGNAATCLIGEQTYYNDPEFGISEWQVAVDADGKELTGNTESSAWGVFTNVFTDPDDANAEPIPYVDYIECHSLGDGESVVIFYSFAEREQYNAHIPNVLDVADSLQLPQGTPPSPAAETPVPTATTAQPTQAAPTAEPASPTTEPAAPTATTPATGEPPVTDLTGDGGSTITGQSFPYSFTVPAGWQVNDSSLGADPESTSLTNGASTVLVQARTMAPATLSDCVANIAGENEGQPAYGDLALASTASGDPFAGEDDFSAFANFTFTGPDGATWSHFVECRWIVQGQSVLVLIQDVPQEAFGSERAARRQIQNSIQVGE